MMSPLKLVVLDISVLGSVWHANRCARRGRITGPTVAPGQLWRVHLLVRRTEHRRIGGRCHRRQTSWLQGEVRPFRKKIEYGYENAELLRGKGVWKD